MPRAQAVYHLIKWNDLEIVVAQITQVRFEVSRRNGRRRRRVLGDVMVEQDDGALRCHDGAADCEHSTGNQPGSGDVENFLCFEQWL